ncbi:MAG: hypothetical protein M4D85_00965 [Actinomycetota bacterium]|nr:hypothetical protein [Actinomycetota bacterium]
MPAAGISPALLEVLTGVDVLLHDAQCRRVSDRCTGDAEDVPAEQVSSNLLEQRAHRLPPGEHHPVELVELQQAHPHGRR